MAKNNDSKNEYFTVNGTKQDGAASKSKNFDDYQGAKTHYDSLKTGKLDETFDSSKGPGKRILHKK